MSTVETERRSIERHEAGVIAGGSLGESIAGAGAVVLAIIGLAGMLQSFTLPIAVLAASAAFLFEGGTVAARWAKLLHRLGADPETVELGTGMSAEFLAGMAGTVLGILALVHVMPVVLMPVAAIIFGGALLFGSMATADFSTMTLPQTEGREALRLVMRQAVSAAAGTQTLVGLGAAALGIIALVGVGNPVVLSLVAVLGVGGALLLGGSAIGAKVLSIFQH